MKVICLTVLATLVGALWAQDPAEGWMAFAVGSIPSKYQRITRLEMTWTVGEAPRRSFAFFSPWFGMDPGDNLNLIQPVNPWSGSSWSMYTEYFQWSPEHNSNSPQRSVQAGQTLHGSLVYGASTDSYDLMQKVVETGVTSAQTVKCQGGKNYTVPYVVFEKTFPCRDYPPDGKVTFHDIVVECDGEDCTSEVTWAAKVKDDNCNMRAHIEEGGDISITWDTSMASKYDNISYVDLHALNRRGWAAGLDPPAVSDHGGDPTYTCGACHHVYDPIKDGGGKSFEDLPDTWTCPQCGAPKSAYKQTIAANGAVRWTHTHEEA